MIETQPIRHPSWGIRRIPEQRRYLIHIRSINPRIDIIAVLSVAVDDELWIDCNAVDYVLLLVFRRTAGQPFKMKGRVNQSNEADENKRCANDNSNPVREKGSTPNFV